MLPGKKYTPEELGRLALKRKWLILVPSVVGVVASVLVARRVPELYQSETLIMVVPQRIPDSIVRRTDAAPIEDRLHTISEQIQSRSRLERIILDFNLYPEERAKGVMEDVVLGMRSNISVRLEGRAQEAFRVGFVSSDPRLAQRVTERLASWYIEENIRDRENLSATTNAFLETELEDAKRRLLDQEKKLQLYRQRYSGQLPSQLETNLQSIQNTQLQLQSISDSVNRARERRLLIERQLADAQMLPVSVAPVDARTSTDEAPQVSAAQQLERAEALLAAAQRRYTPDHPDIRALERNIADLKIKVADEAQRPRPTTAKLLTPAEVARQKRIRDFEAEIEVIDRQIATSQAEQGRLQQVLAGYQAKVDAVPSRESELVELTRGYDTLQAAYTSLLTKNQEANLARNLQRRQIGEQFKVLDPPSLPERPVNAKTRRMVLLGGSAGGLMFGLLLVALLEYRDSSFRTEAEVTRLLSLPVLALVPVMVTGQVDRNGGRNRKLGAAAGVVLLAGSAALLLWRLQS